jgi:hypothetical protein
MSKNSANSHLSKKEIDWLEEKYICMEKVRRNKSTEKDSILQIVRTRGRQLQYTTPLVVGRK